MPIDTHFAMKIWNRYAWCRDNGHADFVEKADICERFFAGDQWDNTEKAVLRMQRRPALTINKILSTMANVMGEQIYNRSEISFRPRSDASAETADALNKVFKQISDNNHLDWLRSDMFADGCITSRGFLDVRVNFDDSMQGEVKIINLNPKNVIVDPDAEEYDPDSWNDLFITKWVTADDIAILYNKEDAEMLRNREQSFFPYGYDSIQSHRDRFGDRFNPMYNGVWDESAVQRNIRIIERQHKQLDRQKHFVLPQTGDMRPIPEDFDRNKIAMYVKQFGFEVTTKLVKRIRWSVIADNVKLHDDWSPYPHFTVVPYFPFFRRGTTIGLVENLIGPQELLNKVSSQELHVVNTTANSGWKVKAGALVNMTKEEFEQRGAESGLVIEVNGDPDKDIVKIQPNQVPQGLDRVSYKAEEHIKTISGVSDSMQGQDRADVAAKAIQAKRQAGATNNVKPMDSLIRSDSILARVVLCLVQKYYTEPRLLTITKDKMSGETEQVAINQPTPEGTIANDLTLGEYDVVTSSVPQRETLEDSQFEQAVSLRELGVELPDSVLIEASRLQGKRAIVKQLADAANTPEAQQAKQTAQRLAAAEADKTEAEAEAKRAEVPLKQAKAAQHEELARKEAITPPEDNGVEAKREETQANIQIETMKAHHKMQLDEMQLDHKAQIEERKAQADERRADQDAAMQRAMMARTPKTQPETPRTGATQK